MHQKVHVHVVAVLVKRRRLLNHHVLLGVLAVLQLDLDHLSHGPRLGYSFVVDLSALLHALDSLGVGLAAVAGDAGVEGGAEVGALSAIQSPPRLCELKRLFDLPFKILEFVLVI